jgi:hypothetical protein
MYVVRYMLCGGKKNNFCDYNVRGALVAVL